MILRVDGFEAWRGMARRELLRGTPPSDVIWQASGEEQTFLFDSAQISGHIEGAAPADSLKFPRAFVETAKTVARHRDDSRWSLLYKVAWRLQNENRNLHYIETDPDIRALGVMRKAVEHDAYKMRAFVRFRQIVHDGAEQYVAWYRPDHYTLDSNERFFAERFRGMHWAILTPDVSMIWDTKRIVYAPGVPRSEAPAEDRMEDLWRVYYGSIYNPARLNLDAMRAQLPVRRWQDLPESRIIPELVRQSRGRVESMAAMQTAPASAFIPALADLPILREAVTRCNACELCGRATQAVFGDGPAGAVTMIVGEQPGDEEDRSGRPFAGPAGKILEQSMREAGMDRSSVYVTNAVKAFRFEERGKRRIHQSPKSFHIATCRPWLDAEIEAVKPKRIVCLGASAAQSVLGRTVRIQEERGRVYRHAGGAKVMITYHPSAALRAPDELTKANITRAFTEDLRAAREA